MFHPGWPNMLFFFCWGSSSPCWCPPPAVELSSGTVGCNRNSNLLCQCILTIIIGLSYFCFKGFEEIVSCWRNDWNYEYSGLVLSRANLESLMSAGSLYCCFTIEVMFKIFEVTWHWRFYTVVFWVMTLCTLVGGCHCCKNVLSSLSTLKRGAVCSSRIFVPTHQSVWFQNPDIYSMIPKYSCIVVQDHSCKLYSLVSTVHILVSTAIIVFEGSELVWCIFHLCSDSNFMTHM